MPTSSTRAPAACDQSHHLRQVGARASQRQAAQAVVGTQFQDDYARLVQLERPRQALQAATGGLSADAGVDDFVPVTLCLKPSREQRHPTLLRPKSVVRH